MSYKEALMLVTSLAHPDQNVYKSNVPHMIEYLHRIGYKVSDLAKLNILHVTGTKGKGSTVLFCESILRQHGVKTGAFISPHLVSLRERFRFDGEPVSEEIFAHHAFEIYDKLQKTKEADTDMPYSFAFMTLLGFDMFLKHGVDALVLEVGVGGEFDCTNVISAPVVCGVSSIHLDHVDKLGNTVQSIAWHKSGIFKPGAPAVTVSHSDGILPILESRATERGVGNPTMIILAPPLDDYETEQPIKLGMPGDVQKQNASLAMQMWKIWKNSIHPGILSKRPDFENHLKGGRKGENREKDPPTIRPNLELTATELKAARIRGRTQIIRHADATYFLDTAHTDVSIKAYSDWFRASTNEEKKKLRGRVVQVLIFHFADDRDLLKPLRILSKMSFDVALFCPLAVDEASRVEYLFPVKTNEEKMCRTIESFDLWKKLEHNNQLENREGQGHTCKNKGDHSHMLTHSLVVPFLEEALALATCGKDGGHMNKETTQRICDEFPEVSKTIRSADHVQVMLAGGHKIIGHSLCLLENC